MSEEKKGAAEWLRGIVDKYEAEEDPGCRKTTELFGVCCDDFKTCKECRVKMMKVVADRIDAERALPEGIEWPRFEDGELVKIGDEVEFEGETMRVFSVAFNFNGWVLWCARESFDGRLCGSYGELVKRPTPKVLDADGVPINVGDTVYGDDEASPLTVVRLFKDATGATLVDSADSLGTYFTFVPSRLTHERPDSWERIEEDAKLAPRDYLESRGMNPEKPERIAFMMADLVRRAKALAKAGE